MLDFFQIHDGQPTNNSPKLKFIGGIEWEEFEEAQIANVVEKHLDYYGKFRWSNESVSRKIAQLKELNRTSLSNLTDILKQANAADCGLIAFGD
ncbi:hypothetical protein [Hymenobacter terricola]|uniref:hypothetical protein n=1 Tax=Hymenobacter terricola TaxID=2819236 RepID=UPI001B3135B2|nr:hypothetical protein [Hymenobacter terricola]